METVAATEFKQRCLAILDRVGPEGIVITKHGKPVAKLVPVEEGSDELIGSLDGKVEVLGDILGTGLRWDAEP
jgi:prevent-host-death family protein